MKPPSPIGSSTSITLDPTLHLNAFRGVRAISWFDWPFTPTHKSSKHFSTYIGSVLHKDTILASTCSWVDHQVSRLAHVAMSPYSDSLSLRFRSLRTYTCHIRLTRRLIMQKARRHPNGLRPLVSVWFQDLFHSLIQGSFHLSLTVLVHYRSLRSI